MALIYSVGLLTDLLLQSQNTNKTHIIPDQFLFGSSSGGQSHSLMEVTIAIENLWSLVVPSDILPSIC
jgi:hypothetical protein